MRMGRTPKKRRRRAAAEASSPQKHIVAGQVSSNLISSLYGPILMDMAERSVEDYADRVLDWSSEVGDVGDVGLGSGAKGNDGEIEVEVEADGSILPTPPKPKPTPPLFSTSQDLESLSALLAETSQHFTTNQWKVRANASKFERLLDEKYGRFRPFIENHPQIEVVIKRLQRKYVMGDFSPFRKERPISLSSSVMLLFMLQRNQCGFAVLILVGLFAIVGLQPWALVGLVSVGKWSVERRRRKRIGGMAKRLGVVEGYFHSSDDKAGSADGRGQDEEKEKERKYSLLTKPVGTKFNPADLSLRDQKFDAVLLGAGAEVLYCAALLARSGKSVCVLCPSDDCSGCVSLPGDEWGSVPFDVRNSDAAHLGKQQALLAPALCTTTDAQGGIRFARVGTEKDGYAHSVLSVPGLGTNSLRNEDMIPVVLNAGGPVEIANYCHDALGDGHANIVDEEGNDDGNSSSLSYLKACSQINSGAGDYYLSRLYPPDSSSEAAFKSPQCDAYRQSTVRTASTFLNSCLPLYPHVRSLMAAIGMANENLRPDKTCMAAHVSNVCAMTSPEGMAYPVGGPRALCRALGSAIEQCGGRVVAGVALQELLFDKTKMEEGKKKEERKDGEKKIIPRCRGIRLENGMEVTTSSDGSVISFLGFIPTFLHLLSPEIRSADGVPVGLAALSERRPLMKILVGIKGTKEELNLTGADWYRLPNATVPRDESDGNGQVKFGTIGVDDGSEDTDEAAIMEAMTEDREPEDETANTGKRGKRSKNPPSAATKAPPRTKFTSGVSWMKVSFPSAKDPSWKERHGNVTTCVVTVEADDDFVKMFDTKPKVYSILKKANGDVERLRDRVLKDLLDVFPQLQGNVVESVAVIGPIRAGLTHDPPKFAIKGNRPKTPYPGLLIGGSDLTVGDSFSGSIAGAWLAANAIMGYSFIDQLYLRKNITSDLRQFLDEPSMAVERNGEIVEDLAVPFTLEEVVVEDKKEKEKEQADSRMGASTAESSKEE